MLLTSVMAVLLIILVLMIIIGVQVEERRVFKRVPIRYPAQAPRCMTGSSKDSLQRVWHGKHPCPPWVVLK